MKTYVSAKLHDLTVTDSVPRYIGSVTIGKDLLEAAGIDEYEQVHVCNLNNGARWITYALAGDDGVFELNGPGARLGMKGDRCVVMTYHMEDSYSGATSVFVDEKNRITKTLDYPLAENIDHHTGEVIG